MSILRTWRGKTRITDGDAYERFMIERAAPDYQSIDGLLRLFFTRQDDGEYSHFLLVTLWRDLDAVQAFAGADATRAKYYPEDARYLIDPGPGANNWRIFHSE